MKKLILLPVILILAACSARETVKFPELPNEPIPQISKELRGAWVTRFAYADEDPDSMRRKIIQTMQNLGDANFNAVFFQVRGQCETLYPSPLEPWSKLVDFKDPGFDPVELAIAEARKHGLKFYAYINLLPMWDDQEGPKDLNHLYYKHGPEVDPGESWVCFGEDGNPMETKGYHYLNPALPEVKSYLKQVIRHFVKTYDIDGIHFDRIRYPGSVYVNDPYSLERFRSDSLRLNINKSEWARRQLTDLVEDVVVEAMLIKPYLVNSAATWGFYKTKDIEGYEHFNSGYAEYYQDAVDWLDKGILDFIVPMIYWDINDPLPNINDLWLDFKRRTDNYKHIYPGLRIYDCDWIENGETASQINFVRQNNGLGTVMFSLGPQKDERYEIIKNVMYPGKVDLPDNMKRTSSRNIYSLNLKNLFSDSADGQIIQVTNHVEKTTDMEGYTGFFLSDKPDTLTMTADNKSISLLTSDWTVPYSYVVNEDETIHRQSPWIEMRRMPRDTTYNSEFPILCKTEYPAKVWINDDSVKIYKTGIFFKNLEFEEGLNRVTVKVENEHGLTSTLTNEFNYIKRDRLRAAFPLWIEPKSVEPQSDLILTPDDIVRISFTGSKEQEGKVVLDDADVEIKCSRNDFNDYSLYQAELPLRLLESGMRYNFELVLSSTVESNEQSVKIIPEAAIQVMELDKFPLVKTTSENSVLTYTLGNVRLGSPIRAEYSPGVILKTSGRIGDNYRVRLSNVEESYIDERNVEILSEETVTPEYYITSMFCAPTDSGDVLSIPYPEPVPYAVYPEPDQNRIVIALFGVKTSSTWITHRNGRKVIDKVTWHQTTPETYTIYVNLNTSKIWGYDIKQVGNSLKLKVKYPPELDSDADKPLAGLKIAIEAGHGGSNFGAIGLSGIKEKDINLDLSLKLEKLCRENGADVLQIRDRDKDMLLGTKRDTSRFSDSNIHISIHANAGGGRGGYLGVSGTSTYYHNPFWAPLAENVYDRLLETDLDEFGVIGSFNYRVTRMTEMPAILVEQAFLSNAEDEEKLADENFRTEMAQKIYEGIIDYLKFMRDK